MKNLFLSFIILISSLKYVSGRIILPQEIDKQTNDNMEIIKCKHDSLLIGIKPPSLTFTPELYSKNRNKYINGDKKISSTVRQLLCEADSVMGLKIYTVVDKKIFPASGNKHDYMSIGPYWWPNPNTKDGLPYIRKDGQVNPERNSTDRPGVWNLGYYTTILSWSYFYTEDEKYAHRVADLIRAFFLNSDTRMNPNMKYAQAIPGVSDGRGTGIIDARPFLKIANAVKLISNSESWSAEDSQKIKSWYTEFLNWLLTHQYGIDEANSKNNHGTWYDVITTHIALYVGKYETAKNILDKVKSRRIDSQIEIDGSQPLELKRTRSFHYSVMNLNGFFDLALFGEFVGIDLWNYSSQDGRSIRKAMDYLIPFALLEQKWKHQMINGWELDLETFIELLRIASIKCNEPLYEKIADRVSVLMPDRNMMQPIYPMLD